MRKWMIPALMLAFAVLACNLPVKTAVPQQTPTVFILPTAETGGAQPLADTPAATMIPTATLGAALEPTITPAVTVTQPPAVVPTDTQPAAPSGPKVDSSGATRLTFAKGATSIPAEGTIQKGRPVKFLIQAGAKQLMILNLSAGDTAVVLQVASVADGKVLLDAAQKTANWQGFLPAAGDYLITILPGSKDAAFSLNITIPRRIQFAAGAITDTYEGPIGPNQTVAFIAGAAKGQKMTVTLTSPGSDVLLTVYGYTDGNPYIRSVSGATSWSDTLPMTQDYIIQAVSVGSSNTFKMVLTIK